MPIVVNGTTIPENVANALNVNGTNITSVVCDGVPVWTQSLNLTWSGNALVSTMNGGLVVSGNTYKWKDWNYAAVYGPVQSVSSTGIFSGNSLGSSGTGIAVSGNLIRPKSSVESATAWLTYTIGTKAFSGLGSSKSMNDNITQFQVSGGLMRIAYIPSDGSNMYSPYISLT